MFRPVLPLLLALLVLPACPREERDPNGLVVARVEGEALTAGSLLIAARVDELAGDYRTALDELIDRHLLLRAAEQKRIRVEGPEVERALARLRSDYPDDTFAEMLGQQGLDEAKFRENLRQSLLIQRLLVDEVVARVAITDEEIEAWLEEHLEAEPAREQVRAAQIVVEKESEALAIRAQLEQGASFEELAKTHSLSPDGKKGGDLGFFARGDMPPLFEEICFSLEPGQISEAVSSSYGFHVFKVLERKAAQAPDPAEQRKEAARSLRRKKEAAAQRAFLTRLRQGAQIEVDEAALKRLVGKK